MLNLIVGIILVGLILLSTFSSKFDGAFGRVQSMFNKIEVSYIVFIIIIIVISLIIVGV